MADMNQLTQLISDVSSEDFFFSVDFDGITKIIWLFLCINSKTVESAFFNVLDAEKAMVWIEEQRAKHGRV